MDLDKLKDTWKSAEVKPTINEEQIQQMLNNKGKSAFNKLIKYERIGFIFSLFLIVCAIGIVVFSYGILNIRNDFFPAFFCISCIFISIWQGYKYRYLHNIDILKMNTLQVYEHINTYKKLLTKEWIVSIVWTIAIFTAFFINKLPDKSLLQFVLIVLSISAYVILVTFIIYKLTISRYLINIEESIKEVEEFKKDNKE